MPALSKLAFRSGLVAGVALGMGVPSVTFAQDAGQASEAERPLDDFSDIEAERQAEEAAQADSAQQEQPDGGPEVSEEAQQALNAMAAVIVAIDPDARRQGNNWELTVDEARLLVVTDVVNGRMRVLSPIAAVEDLPEEALLRLLQANFDTALDARYAVAQNLVWATFIHPLQGLTSREFASGLLQTKSLTDTFGTSFSSGILSFGGGDSNAIIADQLEELLQELERDNTI